MIAAAVKTLHCRFSDRAIREATHNPGITRLRDARYPVELRILADRQQASWYYIWQAGGRQKWRRIGRWPALSARAVVALLPDIAAEVARQGADARVAADHWTYTAELLAWYRDRVAQECRHSRRWQATVRSVVDRHLIPCLGDLPLAQIDRARLDSLLFARRQSQLAPATLHLVWRVLVQACRRATRLSLLQRNPVDGMVARDFLRGGRPVSAHGQLRAQHVPQVMAHMHAAEPTMRTLVMLMLCHGTRVGETRMARWDHVDLAAAEWYIPAENTKTRTAHRLPLTPAVCQWLDDYRSWQSDAGQGCVYLFPAPGLRRPMGEREVSRQIRRLSDGQWTARDLRALARTAWADLGVDYAVSERLLNHAMRQLDTAYIHTHMAARCRRALGDYQRWLVERGALVFGGNHRAHEGKLRH